MLYLIEHAVVLCYEAIRRLVLALDPAVYVAGKRILAVTAGKTLKRSKKFLLLVVYEESSASTLAPLIEGVQNAPFNLAIVANARLDSSQRDTLRKNCELLIERKNVGRDFGAYKDGIEVLEKRCPDIERLIIANDSVAYLPGGLEKLLSDLDGPQDFIAVSEVYEHHYHAASFLLSFGSSVLRNGAFREFWRRYLPIGTRRWAIFRGEGNLTSALLRAGFRPHVLFRAESLRPHLKNRSPNEMKEIISLVPVANRGILEACADKNPASFEDAVIKTIMSTNQMHAGGNLFRKFLEMPLLKRDIVYRGIYSIDDLTNILSDLDPPSRSNVVSDLQRRGTPGDLGLFDKILHRHSAI